MRLHNPLMSREEASLRWHVALGEYVRNLRLAKDLTQTEVCQAVGWHNKQVLSGVERGRTSVPTERIEVLADILGVERSEFAKRVLRYQDPWTYGAIFGKDADLRRELAVAPQRTAKRFGPRVMKH